MKSLILFVFTFVLVSCKNVQVIKPVPVSEKQDSLTYRYSDAELGNFLDSIGRLDPEILKRDITSSSDSVFRNHENKGRTLSTSEFEALKKEDAGHISNYDLLRQLFPKDAEYLNEDMISGVIFYHFSKNKFGNFAVELPGGIGSYVYFFFGNKLLARHSIYHKYGLEMDSFVNENGKTVIYYKVNYLSGTDVFQDNYNFYMYADEGLIPVLNELENSNHGFEWGTRSYWLESTIAGTNPLVIKMVYEQKVPYPEDDDAEYTVVKDSAIVTYNWDNIVKQYTPDFSDTSLNSNIILTYYLNGNELLFINTHHEKLKEVLQGNDVDARKAVLDYLNTTMEAYSKNGGKN